MRDPTGASACGSIREASQFQSRELFPARRSQCSRSTRVSAALCGSPTRRSPGVSGAILNPQRSPLSGKPPRHHDNVRRDIERRSLLLRRCTGEGAEQRRRKCQVGARPFFVCATALIGEIGWFRWFRAPILPRIRQQANRFKVPTEKRRPGPGIRKNEDLAPSGSGSSRTRLSAFARAAGRSDRQDQFYKTPSAARGVTDPPLS